MSEDRKCAISGYLFGVLCEDLAILDPAIGAKVVAVSSQARAATGLALAVDARIPDHKEVVRDASQDEMTHAARDAVAAGIVAADGSFCLEGSYGGGLVDVYVEIDRVPLLGSQPAESRLPEPVRLFLGTFEPIGVADEFVLHLNIPNPVWCRLKRRADAWTIAGRVTTCAEPHVPIGGVTVSAFDTDIVQDDALGSAVTSAAGIFRIDYPGSAYRKGTWIDVELFGGPDVYFKITDSGGTVLAPQEDRSVGRAPGRSDTGPCACFELCVDVPVPPSDPGAIPSIWTGVGIAFTIPDSSALNSFDAAGFAGSSKFALSGAIRMTGSAALRTSVGNPIEYRFLVSPTTTANGSPALPAADFTKVVGVAPNDDLFVSTRVAQMVRLSPLRIVDIDAHLVDLDAEGWLDVNRSIQRVFSTTPGLTPADLPSFQYVDIDGLMAIDTTKLTSAPNPPPGTPGVAIALADRIPTEKVAVRFEVRERTSPSTTVDLSGSGTTLNAMIINNNPVYAELAMSEHLTGTPCGILTGDIHIAYTVHHAHLGSASLNVRSNDWIYNLDLNDPEPPAPPPAPDFQLPLSGNTDSGRNHKNDGMLAVPNTAATPLHKCTYLVTLHAAPRLHNGDSGVGGDPAPQTTFFYQP